MSEKCEFCDQDLPLSKEEKLMIEHVIFLETTCEACGKWDHGNALCEDCEYELAGQS